jgi:hypothetical protein
MSFPNSPTDGQLYTTTPIGAPGVRYRYRAADNAWKIVGSQGPGGTGTANQIVKFLDTNGSIGDSILREVGTSLNTTGDTIYIENSTGTNTIQSAAGLDITAPSASIYVGLNPNDVDLYVASGKAKTHGNSVTTGTLLIGSAEDATQTFEITPTAIKSSISNAVGIAGFPDYAAVAYTVQEQRVMHSGDILDIIHDEPPGMSVNWNLTGTGFIYGCSGAGVAAIQANFNWDCGPGATNGVILFNAIGTITTILDNANTLNLCNYNYNPGSSHYVNDLRLQNNTAGNLLIGYTLTYFKHGASS